MGILISILPPVLTDRYKSYSVVADYMWRSYLSIYIYDREKLSDFLKTQEIFLGQ